MTPKSRITAVAAYKAVLVSKDEENTSCCHTNRLLNICASASTSVLLSAVGGRCSLLQWLMVSVLRIRAASWSVPPQMGTYLTLSKAQHRRRGGRKSIIEQRSRRSAVNTVTVQTQACVVRGTPAQGLPRTRALQHSIMDGVGPYGGGGGREGERGRGAIGSWWLLGKGPAFFSGITSGELPMASNQLPARVRTSSPN